MSSRGRNFHGLIDHLDGFHLKLISDAAKWRGYTVEHVILLGTIYQLIIRSSYKSASVCSQLLHARQTSMMHCYQAHSELRPLKLLWAND